MTIAEYYLTREAVEQAVPMTYEQFLALPDPIQAEWVDGIGTIFALPNTHHQELLGFLATLVGTFVELNQLGTTPFAPYEMLLAPNNRREPDLLFVGNANHERITPKRLEGPADLVVELISTESSHRDRVDKFDAYEAAGVREYWLIDPRPNRNRANFYHRDAHGQYQPILLDAEGRFTSVVLPNFVLPVHWLWQEPLPALLAALATMVEPAVLLAALQRP